MNGRSRIFRVFFCSTHNDFAAERNALHAEVFPPLEAFCRQRGAQFHPIDLRWGISEEAGCNQQKMEICLDEVKRCQRSTARPNFVLLLGNRPVRRGCGREVLNKHLNPGGQAKCAPCKGV
jgi:hypothetical protein